MKNRKMMTSLVLITAASVIVGSGFSAWYFSETSTPVGVTGSVNVEPSISNIFQLYIPVSKVKHRSNPSRFKVFFDQGGIGNTDPSKGIYVVNPDSVITPDDDNYSNVDFKNTWYYNDMNIVPCFVVGLQYENLSNLGPISKVACSTYLDIVYDTALYNYTSFQYEDMWLMDFINSEVIGDKTHEYFQRDMLHSFTTPKIIDGTQKYYDMIGMWPRGDVSQPFLEYNQGMKPTTIQEYKDMKAAVDGTSIQLNFSVRPLYIELGDGSIIHIQD